MPSELASALHNAAAIVAVAFCAARRLSRQYNTVNTALFLTPTVPRVMLHKM